MATPVSRPLNVDDGWTASRNADTTLHDENFHPIHAVAGHALFVAPGRLALLATDGLLEFID